MSKLIVCPSCGKTEFQIRIQPNNYWTAVEETAWEVANDVEWENEYPLGKHGYKERIPDIVNDVLHKYKLTDMKKQVDGIQKKMDRVIYLIENAEFTIKGKEVMKL
jgi:hypothetical protein